MTESSPPTTLRVLDVATALRALPYGGMDDGARELRMPASVQAAVSPVVSALRVATVMVGLLYAATRAGTGDIWIVYTLAVVLFVATWRTVRPLRLGSTRRRDRALAFTDVAIVSVAVGWGDAVESPFVFCVVAATAITSFGWGLPAGVIALGVGAIAMGIGATVHHNPWDNLGAALAVTSSSGVAVVVVAALGRRRLIDEETRREQLAGTLHQLVETNDMLSVLNHLARTLPMTLDLREAVAVVNRDLNAAFAPDTSALLLSDDSGREWSPQLAMNCALAPAYDRDELPQPLRAAVDDEGPVLYSDLGDAAAPGGLNAASGSGLYTALRARGEVMGVIAVEATTVGRYRERDRATIAALGDLVALSIDNARSFRRLRTLGADEERVRLARELHDRLGQWLTYIAFELERIMDGDEADEPQLHSLYDDVQKAIDELRETLHQLRSAVTRDNPFSVVVAQLIDRFNRREQTVASLEITDECARLPIPVENELLRITQEALSNVTKHAAADTVTVRWDVTAEVGTLSITDDGRGFDASGSVRDAAYGLVGMRERAAAINATLQIAASKGAGTTVTVIYRASAVHGVESTNADTHADLVIDVTDTNTTDRAPHSVTPIDVADGAVA